MRIFCLLLFVFFTNVCWANQLPKEINIITYAGNPGSTGNKNQMLILFKQSLLRHDVETKIIYRAGAQGVVAMNMFWESKTDGSILGIFGASDLETREFSELRKFQPDDFEKLFYISKHYWVLTASNNYKPKTDVLFAVNGVTKVELIKMYCQKLGIDPLIVPYPSTKGETQIMLDISEDRVNLFFAAINGAIPLYQAGRIKLLGVTSKERLPTLKEIPAISESIANFEYSSDNTIYIHKNVPQSVKLSYKKLFNVIANDAQFRDEIILKYNQPMLKVY